MYTDEQLAAWTALKKIINEWQQLAAEEDVNLTLVEEVDDNVSLVEQLFII